MQKFKFFVDIWAEASYEFVAVLFALDIQSSLLEKIEGKVFFQLMCFFDYINRDLKYAGVLNPTDMPHHLRAYEESAYREGIVLDKKSEKGASIGTIHILRKHFYIAQNLIWLPNFSRKLDFFHFQRYILTKFSCGSLKFLVHEKRKKNAQKIRVNVVVD